MFYPNQVKYESSILIFDWFRTLEFRVLHEGMIFLNTVHKAQKENETIVGRCKCQLLFSSL